MIVETKLFLYPNDWGLFLLFQKRDIKLQIDTKVNVQGLQSCTKLIGTCTSNHHYAHKYALRG